MMGGKAKVAEIPDEGRVHRCQFPGHRVVPEVRGPGRHEGYPRLDGEGHGRRGFEQRDRDRGRKYQRRWQWILRD
jgi:hypothetical protein